MGIEEPGIPNDCFYSTLTFTFIALLFVDKDGIPPSADGTG